jgi:hypothetical protein
VKFPHAGADHHFQRRRDPGAIDHHPCQVWPDAPAPYWLIPLASQCGVVNRYRNPAQLGSDRGRR